MIITNFTSAYQYVWYKQSVSDCKFKSFRYYLIYRTFEIKRSKQYLSWSNIDTFAIEVVTTLNSVVSDPRVGETGSTDVISIFRNTEFNLSFSLPNVRVTVRLYNQQFITSFIFIFIFVYTLSLTSTTFCFISLYF